MFRIIPFEILNYSNYIFIILFYNLNKNIVHTRKILNSVEMIII